MNRLKAIWEKYFPRKYSYEELMRVFSAGQQMGFIEGYEAGKSSRLTETAQQALDRLFTK